MSNPTNHEPTHSIRLLRDLREIRKARGMTQADLAQASNVCPREVCSWEHGETIPRLLTFEALINALGHDLKIVKRKA
jgi:transcriptional regulator with XRE-family HTH domain